MCVCGFKHIHVALELQATENIITVIPARIHTIPYRYPKMCVCVIYELKRTRNAKLREKTCQ